MTIKNSFFVTTVVAALIAGCATTSLESKTFRSYSVGKESAATIGEAFLIDQDGYVETVKSWVGYLHSPDGWKTEKRYSQDFVRRELLYSGKSGNTIEIAYREFRGGYAAPAFFQNLKYDLTEAKIIQFQKFKIEVIDVNNQKISYKILRDY